MKPLDIGGKIFSPDEMPLLIAGPCVLEKEEDALRVAAACADIARKEGFFYIFKSSYLKDNRSSIDSYSGPGMDEGLRMLERIRRDMGVPVLTDIHSVEQAGPAAEICDVLQIPAFMARQTSLVVSAAETGRIINLKKGQFLSPEEMGLAVEKAERGGAAGVIVTERGTFFGYSNLVVDMTSFPRMRRFNVPLVFDVTHSLQLPGVLGDRSGGRPQYASSLARAAAGAGCDGFFVETHFEPLSCSCDAEVMLPLVELGPLLRGVSRIYRSVRENE